MVDSRDAEGNKDWKDYKPGGFRAYNSKGTAVEDENKNKGQMALTYRLPQESLNSDDYYTIRIHYAPKRGNEIRVPVKVRARRSSPIVRVTYPFRPVVDQLFEIDAGSSYSVQGNELEYEWRQTSGTPVEFPTEDSSIAIRLPRRDVMEAAWVALCRALVRHPDFLFTRPPSLSRLDMSVDVKKILNGSRLALDLVGRSLTQNEVQELKSGLSFERLADRFLNSNEFREFYFHRVRLYLESQGTEIQDEPARIWAHIAFNDRPFQEILTADYTVDSDFRKINRPSYHGKTGLLTSRGFIDGKPGLPHYNYAAQVSMLFLGYVYEVPPEIVEQREGVTALGTTDPKSACYGCHKILTPLAFQRSFWSDDGRYRTHDDVGLPIESSDQGMVDEYPFKGEGMEAFALQAVRKERFIRTMINTHFSFYFGRSMRYRTDERELYRSLWNGTHQDGFQLKKLIRRIVLSPHYFDDKSTRLTRLIRN
jgi:hypothetical protein